MTLIARRQDAGKFAEQILEPGDRFREDSVDGPVFDVLRQQPRCGDNREERGKNVHRAERDVLQHLKFLLETHPRHECGAADQDQREDQDNVKNLHSRQLRERIQREGADPSKGEGGVLPDSHESYRTILFRAAGWRRGIDIQVMSVAAGVRLTGRRTP